MRILLAISVLFLLSFGVTAQSTEIAEKQFKEIETKSAELLKTTSHRLVRTLEYFDDKSKDGRTRETFLRELLLPNKWRTVEEKFYDKPTRTERLWDGKFLYEKQNDDEWRRYSGGSSVDYGIETGKITTSYNFIRRAELNNGKVSDVYEVKIDRIARKMSQTDTFTVHYIRRLRFWFAPDGKLLKKIEENEIEGRNDLSRETTIVDYDAIIKIEAPIK